LVLRKASSSAETMDRYSVCYLDLRKA
jgi:hypothetical protein